VYRLLTKELQIFGILSGEPGHMVFKYAIDNFINNRYFIAGQLLQWSIRNGGPGLPVFSTVVFDKMAGVEPSNVFEELEYMEEPSRSYIKMVHTIFQVLSQNEMMI